MTSVLFICTGNICRSPTAEGIFRHKLAARRLSEKFVVDSAGLIGYHVGEAPDPRTQKTASRHGVDLSKQRSRKVTLADFEKFDYLVAMDESHLQDLQQMAPKHSQALCELMLKYHPNPPSLDVPDPYYGAGDGFETVYHLLDTALESFLDHLEDRA